MQICLSEDQEFQLDNITCDVMCHMDEPFNLLVLSMRTSGFYVASHCSIESHHPCSNDMLKNNSFQFSSPTEQLLVVHLLASFLNVEDAQEFFSAAGACWKHLNDAWMDGEGKQEGRKALEEKQLWRFT